MIVLDTNVVSELTGHNPDESVAAWAAGHPLSDLFVTSITVAEIRLGIAMMPFGRKRRKLSELADAMFGQDLRGRILPFDWAAADAYSEIRNGRKERGRPMSVLDAQIASIAAVRGADLATRNVRDFDGCGVRIVNPWDAEGI